MCFDIPFLSNDGACKPFEIPHARDEEIYLLQTWLSTINNPVFKQRPLSIRFKSKEIGDGFGNLKSTSNRSFIEKQLSQAGCKIFSPTGSKQQISYDISYLAETPSNTDTRLITFLVAKYNESKKWDWKQEWLRRFYTDIIAFGRKMFHVVEEVDQRDNTNWP